MTGLTQALASAISGLQVNQANIALVSSNVANADTPGYTRKTLQQVSTGGDGSVVGVRVAAIQRELDQYVQRQLRVENSGASYADVRAQFYDRLQSIYGQPGADNSLETVYNNFTNALQSLTTSPDDTSARSAVISNAQLLAQQLNQMSASVQGLRSDCELGIADAVTKANQAMSQIATLNQQIAASSQKDSERATLLDQRDYAIDQLSQLMDINVVKGDNDQVTVFTNSGIQLAGTKAASLSFNAQGTITPASQWNANPSQSSLGTIILTAAGGNGTTDLIQNKAIRSGTIAAYLQMRDTDLVQAQSQLDAIAAAMSSALSDKTTTGTTVANGFDVDLGSLSDGNTVTVNYTDIATSTTHTITLVKVDDPSVLPLPDSTTIDPNDKVVGIDFSGGMASVISQINAAIGSTNMTASNPSGNTLEILDDGGVTVKLNALSTTATVTTVNSGNSQLPLFTDGSLPFTGAISSSGAQQVGLSGRIAVNPTLAADPSGLVLYQASTPAGDATRPNFLYQQMVSATLNYSPNSGIGTTSAPFSGTLPTFLRQVISQQGEAANSADSLKQGQDVVLNTLQQRYNDGSSVNIDQEMSNLLILQNSYAANARLMSTVQTMFQTLLQM